MDMNANINIEQIKKNLDKINKNIQLAMQSQLEEQYIANTECYNFVENAPLFTKTCGWNMPNP